ncbi:MAG: nicotinate-nucleotide--dimethylbenzimidazole phosphoribosyltransferase [Rhodospirillales bacterium]|nr:nicotinate-nucleotide--dimethylbenzimidazole phosphoribosyltransferase [Rhodospirillales bacterium]
MQDDVQLGSLSAFRARVEAMPGPDEAAAERARAHDAQLTKPGGALGRLETLATWAAAWQGRHPPRAERIQVLVFAGNHGVASRGVSAYPPAVTAQMVANFEAGGAAINQLCGVLGAELTVVPLDLDTPTEDMTQTPALGEADCVNALEAGMAAVDGGADLLCLGEMGIGNTTAAAALAAALCGGDGAAWVGPGTGVDADGLARKAAAVDAALARHAEARRDPLAVLSCVGGRELAAIAGAVVQARHCRVPVLLDGFACTAAAAVIAKLRDDGLEHAQVAHRSAEPGHRRLLEALAIEPLLDLGLRLGEASGAALAAALVRMAVTAHNGMATFESAGVSGPAD